MLKLICREMAATIQRETGAVVAVTMITADTFSVFSLDGERFDSVVALLWQAATLTERLTINNEGVTEHYAYFSSGPVEDTQDAACNTAARQWSAGLAAKVRR